MTNRQEQAVAAIDVGGTNIIGGLIDRDGKILFKTQKAPRHLWAGSASLEI